MTVGTVDGHKCIRPDVFRQGKSESPPVDSCIRTMTGEGGTHSGKKQVDAGDWEFSSAT